MKILITGSAGFIGYHLAQSLLLDNNISVIGIDNINDYYDTKLKKSRLANLKNINFSFYQIDISDKSSLDVLFS